LEYYIYCDKYPIQYFIENLGYFVDYYEPKLNIVVEYDEPRHYVYHNLKSKDIKRMNEIKLNLKCQFLRYNEYTKELKEY
jgi:very-short-patch-repair endonuclease